MGASTVLVGLLIHSAVGIPVLLRLIGRSGVAGISEADARGTGRVVCRCQFFCPQLPGAATTASDLVVSLLLVVLLAGALVAAAET